MPDGTQQQFACISVGDWKLLQLVWAQLPTDGSYESVSQVGLSGSLKRPASNIAASLRKLCDLGVLKKGEVAKSTFARGIPCVDVRVRSDSPASILQTNVDEYLAAQNGQPTIPASDPEPAPAADLILHYLTPERVRSSDTPLGPIDIRVGQLLWQEVGLTWLDVSLAALAQAAGEEHAERSLIRLINAGGFVLRADGKIRRGNPKVYLAKASVTTGREVVRLDGEALPKMDPSRFDSEDPNLVLRFLALRQDHDQTARQLEVAERALAQNAKAKSRLMKQLEAIEALLPGQKETVAGLKSTLRSIELSLKDPEFHGCSRLVHIDRSNQYRPKSGSGAADG